MGRRSFWYNLTNKDSMSVEKIIDILLNHNKEPFEKRGENIDTCLLFNHDYQNGDKIEWLYFSSGGGDWVTMEYFEEKYPEFFNNLIRLGEFIELNDENNDWVNWDISKNYMVNI